MDLVWFDFRGHDICGIIGDITDQGDAAACLLDDNVILCIKDSLMVI